MGQDIYDSISEDNNKVIWTVDDSEHTEMWLDHNEEYKEKVEQLLRRMENNNGIMMQKKCVKAVSVIKGVDGPTSIFLLGRKKQSLKQRIYQIKYNYRKKKAIRNLKVQPHSMEEVIEYAKRKYGYVEISKESERYQEKYKQMRTSFIMMYEPTLLGDLSERPKLAEPTEDALEKFQNEIEQRQKRAEKVPADVFDIELFLLERDDFNSSIMIEKKYNYIGGSASGNKKQMKEFRKNYRDIHLYFGVEQADIDNQTRRYKDLISTLAN